MSLVIHVDGKWPTNNHLLDMARKSGARAQERKRRGMAPAVDDFNNEIRDWKLRVKAAYGKPLSEFAKAGPFIVAVVQAGGESRRDADSSGMAAKFAIDALLPKDHGLCGVFCMASKAPGMLLTFIHDDDASANVFRFKNDSAVIVSLNG